MLSPRKNRKKPPKNEDRTEPYPLIMIEVMDGSQSIGHHEIYVLDINDSGMGITCDYPLKVGQTIKFIEDQTDWELPNKGVVMWTFKASDGFQAGIKFN